MMKDSMKYEIWWRILFLKGHTKQYEIWWKTVKHQCGLECINNKLVTRNRMNLYNIGLCEGIELQGLLAIVNLPRLILI